MKLRTILILVLLLLVAGFGVWAGYQIGYKPPPPPEIRTEIVEVMVPVEVVKEIEVEVPGPERVVERVVWRTREVEVPGPVREIIQQIPVTEPIKARILVNALKYEGTVDGKLVRGWNGIADCQVRSESIDWQTMASEPFDKTLSFTESTDEPGTPEERQTPWRVAARLGLTTSPGIDFGLSWTRRSRLGWYVGGQYDLDPESASFYDYGQDGYRSIASDRWRLSAGVQLTLGRK